MQNRLLMRSILLFLVTIYFALASQNNDVNNHQFNIKDDNTPQIFRIRRATRKPGFFRTLFSVVYEQWSDTKNTISKVNQMINDNFLPENAPKKIIESTTISNDPNVTTTKAPYRITRKEFNRILQKNLRGLVRLYNIELQDALKQSDRSYAQFRKNASIEVSKFL